MDEHLTPGQGSDCGICHDGKTILKTHCGNFFHLNCLVSKGLDKRTCPECKQSLEGKDHFLRCRVCQAREVEVPLGVVRDVSLKKYSHKHVKCPDCQNVDTI